MILKAIEKGVSEARIAKALNVDVASIRRRRKLLDGICAKAVELLKEEHLTLNTFSELRKLAPIRQIRGLTVCPVRQLLNKVGVLAVMECFSFAIGRHLGPKA